MSEKPIARAPCGPENPLRLGVLVSDSGIHLQALIHACQSARLNATIEVVISNRKESPALERARTSGLQCRVLPKDAFETQDSFDQALVNALELRDVELVCVTGYPEPISQTVLDAFPNRVLTIHASLLPAFAHEHPIRTALKRCVRITGTTLFFVEPEKFNGAILLQSALRVWSGDDEESLAIRMQVLEHKTFSAGIQLIAEGRVKVDGNQVAIEDGGTQDDSLLWLREELEEEKG